MVKDGSGSGKRKLPIACDLTSMSALQRERYGSLTGWMRENVWEVRELTRGYELCFDYGPFALLNVSEFVTLERLCCPFVDFRFEVRSGEDVFSLFMTGEGETKKVLEAELVSPG